MKILDRFLPAAAIFLAALGEELNRVPVRFPGTQLRLHYAIAGPR